MIFFGTRGKSIAGEQVNGITCQSCGHDQHFSFGVQRYFHVYWLPMLPTSRLTGMECAHCKRTLTDNEIEPDTRKRLSSTLFTRRKLLPLFSAPIIMAVLFVLMMVSASQIERVDDSVYLDHPLVGDYYIVNMPKLFDGADEKYKYGTLRVVQVDAAEVQVRVSSTVYKKTSGPSKDIRRGKAKVDSYYSGDTVSFSLQELKEMRQSGALYSAIRH